MRTDFGLVSGWRRRFDDLAERIGPYFGRRDLRRRATGYLRGLLGSVARKNSWQLAESIGDATPHGLQRLLGRARWDAALLRDELVRYVREHVLAKNDPGVLIVDETGFLKKGTQSVGVQRQYSGTAGKIDNCQIGVFVALAGARGRALIDRELYLPKSWCEDETRLREAGVPEGVRFATKPQLAIRMIDRTWDAGVRPQWVLADEAYGSDHKFRRFLESADQPYVVAVSRQQRLWMNWAQQRVDRIAEAIPGERWFRMSIGEGAKGPRLYDWAAGRLGMPTEAGLIRWLLIRRSLEDTQDRAYYLCAAPPHATAQELAIAAGRRWSIECCFETAKQHTGLDEYEVRSWRGWYRHITLSMLALAFLVTIRAEATERPQKKTAVTWCR